MRVYITVVVLILFSLPLCGGIKITPTENPLFPDIRLAKGETDKLSDQYGDQLDNNGPALASALLFSNIMGYANGTPRIGRYEFGVSMGGSFANMGFLDDAEENENKYPLAAPILSLHAGMPLSKDSDLTVKLTIFDMVVTG